MKHEDLKHCPNRVVAELGIPASQLTKADIIRFVTDNSIKMVNFMYPANDNRLKTLNFVVNSVDYLDSILTYGERVDGSSLFPFIEAGNSDLYVIPRYSTAFVDPFAEQPTLTMLASFFNKDGQPLEESPEQTLRRACARFTESTGAEFHAMGELEYYVIAPTDGSFAATDQKGYHESSPFARFNDFRTECMWFIAQAGGEIKYGHSEVGNFTLDGRVYEQNEIEFLPVEATRAADHLMLAKWIIRTLAAKRGLDVTFAPKITAGKAGSGLHIHFKIVKNGVNMMLDENGRLSDDARCVIAGILDLAPAITAMGNKVPTSYLRLVPHQEAPTAVCWGDRNRSVLVRVPLGWTADADMSAAANPSEPARSGVGRNPERQTAELRSGDCSADVYQLIAAMAVAARRGMEHREESLRRAEATYVAVNIHDKSQEQRLGTLQSLPDSCVASAACLADCRAAFEELGVFSPRMIDGIIDGLMKFDDADLRERLNNATENEKMKVVRRFWHCG